MARLTEFHRQHSLNLRFLLLSFLLQEEDLWKGYVSPLLYLSLVLTYKHEEEQADGKVAKSGAYLVKLSLPFEGICSPLLLYFPHL
jgi:hypothetical protein